MNATELKTELDRELAIWKDKFMANNHPQAFKEFCVVEIRKATDRLLELAETLRKNYGFETGKGWSAARGFQKCLLAQGQDINSLFFSWNLERLISDKIEHFYGVDFSGLRVWPRYYHKVDGSTVYVAYNPADNHDHGDRISFYKDCEFASLPIAEFHQNYQKV